MQPNDTKTGMAINNRVVFQLVLEAAIPLAGFFLWNWSLYFIVLFYILDLFSREIVTHFKAKRRLKHNPVESKKTWVTQGALSLILLGFSLVLIHFFFFLYQPEMNQIMEAKEFWMYEDLGIKQGYFLLPLVALTAFAQYRQEFIFTARYKTVQLKQIWSEHLRTRFALLAGIGLGIGICQLLPNLTEVFYVFTIIVLSSLYNFKFRKI